MKKTLFLSGMILLLLLPVFGIFAQNRDWSIVASYTVPGKASGLAWDGTFLYYGIYGANGDIQASVYPNPLSAGAGSPLVIEYALQQGGTTTVHIMNSLGIDLGILHEAEESAGAYKILADLSGLSSGIYFIRIQNGNSMTSIKITIN